MNSLRIIVCLSSLWLFSRGTSPAQAVEYSETLLLMGSRFSLTAIAEDSTKGRRAVEAGIAEIQRIEALISSWQDSSETSRINRSAGMGPVTVSPELFALIRRSKKVSSLTDGAFDISFAGMERLWRFDGSMTQLPDSQNITASVRNVDWTRILLNERASTVSLEPGMKIGLGGIGKGYAANRAKAVMITRGATGGIVNAGGDLTTWGPSLDGDSWSIAIANPVKPDEPIGWLKVRDLAVVTSGNYERYALIHGRRYAHIIDPRTGWPAKDLASVTMVCPDAELADALATAVFVLGKEKGLSLINQLVGIECLLIDEQGDWAATDGLVIE